MHQPATFALFLIAACAISTGAGAQKVYKCGASYSQTPCPDGVAVPTDDARTAAQKAAADATTRDAAAQAQQLEKARHQDAAQALAARPEGKVQGKPKAKDANAAAKKKKRKEPEHFTARNPADTKK